MERLEPCAAENQRGCSRGALLPLCGLAPPHFGNMSASRGRRKAVRTSTGQFVAGKNGTEETATVTPTTTAVVLATAAIAPAAAANTADSSATPAVSTARRAAVPSAFGLGKGQGRKATDATAAATAVSERGRGKQPATPEARATAPDKADKATDSKAGISLPEKAEVFEIESSDDDDDIEIDEVGNGVSVPASNERPLDLAGKHLPDSLKLVTVIELTEVIHVFEGMVAFVDNQGREWCIHKSSPPLRPGGGYSPHTGVPEFRPKSLDHFGRMSETVRSSAHVWKVESKEQVNITPMVRGSGFQISPFPQTSKRWDTEGANSHPFPFYIVNYTPAFVAAVIAAVSAVEDVIHAGDLTASSGGGGGAPAVEPASTPSLAGPTPAPSKDGYKEASDHFEAMHVMNANFLKRLFPDHPSERASVDGTDSAMTCKLLRAELATKHGQLVSMTEERDRARSRGDSLQTTSVRDITALESVVTNLDRDCKAAASSVAALELTIKNLQVRVGACPLSSPCCAQTAF